MRLWILQIQRRDRELSEVSKLVQFIWSLLRVQLQRWLLSKRLWIRQRAVSGASRNSSKCSNEQNWVHRAAPVGSSSGSFTLRKRPTLSVSESAILHELWKINVISRTWLMKLLLEFRALFAGRTMIVSRVQHQSTGRRLRFHRQKRLFQMSRLN